MANDYTTLNPGTGGDAMDEESVVYGDAPITRKRARVVIGGTTAAAIADVKNTTPGSTDYGAITRSIVSLGDGGSPASEESIILLRKILKVLESNTVVDAKQRQKVVVEAVGTNNAAPTEINATVPVSGTVSATISALVASGANAGNVTVQYGPQGTAAATGGLDSRFLCIDEARSAYAGGIRQNLVWS